MDFVTFYNDAITSATLLLDVALLAFLATRFFARDFYSRIRSFLKSNAIILSLGFALASTFGALIYSNVVGYPACSLCLLQRVFMFPLPIVFFVAFMSEKYSRVALRIALVLAFAGVGAAGYHLVKDMLVLYAPTLAPLGCPEIKGVPSCDRIYIMRYGYITIPTIALTAFAWIGTICMIALAKKNK
jgi:disulfide bond formation protein DsbB